MQNDWVGIITALSGSIGAVVTWLLTRHKTKREEWEKLYNQAAKDRDDFHNKWLAAEDKVDELKRELDEKDEVTK
ncbi:hypothetical protein [Lapidilactobacillus bayanensis]|uniref:hypothetical protein n=1 Tax=Lapidilactobacillus bayanensis TaxID=2485998 RepID=UPI000F767EB6|nr:hypothetical protein [Lapidilactobacillus bayanensis]